MISPEMRALARAAGALVRYTDMYGVVRYADEEALGLVLADLLGIDEQVTPETAGEHLRGLSSERRARRLDPVYVARGPIESEVSAAIRVRAPASELDRDFELHVDLASGETRRVVGSLADLSWRDVGWASDDAGARHAVARLRLPFGVPIGYHRLRLQIGGGTDVTRHESLLVAAPTQAPPPKRGWGVLLPLYAAWSRSPRTHVADYAVLAQLRRLAGEQGADYVGTLPILPQFLDRPFEPSPYAPISRLFWSELFVDPVGLAARLGVSRSDLPELEIGHDTVVPWPGHRLDLKALWRHRKRALGALADRVFASERSAQRQAIEAFGERRPEVISYARFRAAADLAGQPPAARNQEAQDAWTADPLARTYVLAQWAAEAQLGESVGAALALDLPLGTHPHGYDVWRRPERFAQGCSAGAPPDDFSDGQNWGFPPLVPSAQRASGYDYFGACLRHHFSAASLLRIDHVMQMQRLFWIPSGLPASRGVYVKYPADELFAVIALEATLAGAAVAGEDLGTVPEIVRREMDRHGVRRLWVGVFSADADHGLEPPAMRSVASLGTHDTAAFSAWWSGLDLRRQWQAGRLDEAGLHSAQDLRRRQRHAVVRQLRSAGYLGPADHGAPGILAAWLEWLAAGPAEVLLVNLENLWLERRPQNIPGEGADGMSFQRTALFDVSSGLQVPGVAARLSAVRRGRRFAPGLA